MHEETENLITEASEHIWQTLLFAEGALKYAYESAETTRGLLFAAATLDEKYQPYLDNAEATQMAIDDAAKALAKMVGIRELLELRLDGAEDAIQ